MPPTADTIEGRILAEVKSALEDNIVAGTAYFYPPDIVALVEPPPMQYVDNYKEQTQIYLVHEEDILVIEKTTGTRRKHMEVFVNGFRRNNPEFTDPIEGGIQGEESRASIRAKMRHDIEKVFDSETIRFGGTQFGGLVENIDYKTARILFADIVTQPEWVGIEMLWELQYETKLADPTSL